MDLTPYTDSLGRPVSTNPRNLTALGDDLFFFTADEDVSDFIGLWRSDGTPGGTFSVDNGPDDIRELTPAGDKLLFYIGGDEGEESLRRTDGTLAGTLTLLETYPRDLAELTAVGRGVFFRYRSGGELLRSDGTVAGTVLVRDLGSPPRELTAFRGRLFFTAEDATHGRELWVSDGTPGGTVLFKDLAPGVLSSAPEALAVAGGYLFFSAETLGRGREPWVSDGTPEGTVPLREVAPGTLSSSPRGFIQSGWDIFFTAEDGTHGRELFALPFRPEDECDAGLH